MFLQYCDYLIGSPTALADPSIEAELRGATGKGGLYIPAGALWGGPDIRKMADMGTLKVSSPFFLRTYMYDVCIYKYAYTNIPTLCSE